MIKLAEKTYQVEHVPAGIRERYPSNGMQAHSSASHSQVNLQKDESETDHQNDAVFD